MVSTIKVNVNKFNCSIHDLVGFTWNVNFLGDTYKWKIVGVIKEVEKVILPFTGSKEV